MHLDEFLNAQGIATLQTIQWVWAPTTRRSSSKSELLRLLRRVMLAPESVRERYQALERTHQEFLRGLLRLEGYEGNVELITRRLSSPPPSRQANREILDELARQGFLVYTTTKSSGRREAFRATIPQELGDTLAEALNIDTRDPALMLTLDRYLAAPSRHERARLADTRLPAVAQLDALTEPAAVEKRIAALPDPDIQRAVRIALDHDAGVLPLERFPSHGLDIEAVGPAEWRRALEEGLLGTFGHLSLLEHGIGDDHDCLVVYQEIVQRRAAAQAAPELALDRVYGCGIGFLTDLGTLVDFVRGNPCKLTGAGRFFKGARNQLLPAAGCRTTFYMDEDSLLAFKLTVARELNLVELRADGRLHASSAGRDWQALPLVEKARTLLDVLLELGDGAVAQPHFRGLAAAAQQAALAAKPGDWYPTNAFLGTILSTHLTRLLEQGPPQSEDLLVGEPPLWLHAHSGDTLHVIAANSAEPLLRALNYAGLIDIGQQGESSFVRTTPLVPVILGDANLPEPPPGQLLLVNPDFEVILFPEANHIELLHQLCAFCEREKSEVTIHLRITQESIQRAALRGIDPETIIATLRTHCRVPLSQNIEYSIRNWAASVHPAEVQTLHVLELPSAEILDAALQLPEIAPLVLRRLSPTAAALRVPELGPKAQDALAQLGIYLT